MDNSPLYGLVIFAVFILINAVLYAFGEATRTVNEADIEKRALEGDKKFIKIRNIMDKPEKFVNTVSLVTSVTVAYIGFYHLEDYAAKCKDFFVNIFGKYLIDEVLAVMSYLLVGIYLLFLVVSIGMICPKKIGVKYSEKTVRMLVGFVNLVMKLLTPFTAIISFFARVVLFVIGIDAKEEISNVTEDEIISMVNEGHEQGVLEESEVEMISNIIELDEKTAGDIMVHRKNIVAVDGDWTLEQTVGFVVKQRYSRFPVYVNDIDNVIGILHLRNAMSTYHIGKENSKSIKDISDLLMEAKFIPESKNADDLFKEMQLEKTHMEIVVDEYGQTSGIVAMEDILEEIVGNIMDEYDTEENNIVKESDGTYLIKGMTTLEEMEEEFLVDFENEDYDTLNGLLISKLDRIPSDDEKPVLEIGNFKYQILSIKDKMISLVKVTKMSNISVETENEE